MSFKIVGQWFWIKLMYGHVCRSYLVIIYTPQLSKGCVSTWKKILEVQTKSLKGFVGAFVRVRVKVNAYKKLIGFASIMKG